MRRDRMTVEEAREAGLLPDGPAPAPARKRGRNRGNVPTEVDGIKFPSKKEARRYQELKIVRRAEGIRRLRRQVTFPLVVKGWPVYEEGYRADFTYYELEGGEWFFVVEDCKGHLTETYLNKERLMKAIYGIIIRRS
jgi:hypothetical protein